MKKLKIIGEVMLTPIAFLAGGFQVAMIYLLELKDDWQEINEAKRRL